MDPVGSSFIKSFKALFKDSEISLILIMTPLA